MGTDFWRGDSGKIESFWGSSRILVLVFQALSFRIPIPFEKSGMPGVSGYSLSQSAPWWNRVKIKSNYTIESAHTRTHTHIPRRAPARAHMHTHRLHLDTFWSFILNSLSSGTLCVNSLTSQLRKTEIGTTNVWSRSSHEIWIF